MRSIIAACGVALLALIVVAPATALTTVNVRIEGREGTLFEGRVAAEPHGVRASSDKLAPGKLRRCDGVNVNDPSNTVPGLTPTAVSADAMALVGETFDAQWFKQFEDYFVTRWGSDAQDPAGNVYWGILVDNVFTSVGGCQYQLHDGDEVLWVEDAFKNRPTLALLPQAAHYVSGERPRVIDGVAADTPVPVEVLSYADGTEHVPPASPSRSGASGFEGATVAAVETGAKGFEKVLTSGSETFLSGAGGAATVQFSTPGWHRIKATVGAPGLETVVRSNRLDICVSGGSGAASTVEGASSCAQLPPADEVRTAPSTSGEVEVDGSETAEPSPAPSGAGDGPAGPPAPGTLRVSVPKLNRAGLASGAVVVSWQVLSAGPGIKKWTISSRALGQKHARWVPRASGATKAKATIHLPRGHAYQLRFAITDAAGTTSTVALGAVKVPAAPRRRGR